MIKIKNIGTFLMMICVVSCLPFTLLGSISYTHVLNETDLNIYDVTAPDGTVFSRITGTDMFGEGEEGHPEIPYKVIRFLVPDNAYDFSVEIVEIEGVGTIELSHEIYPNQLPIPINDYTDDMFCYPNEIAYRETSGSFRAEVLEESRLEGKYHIIAVGLWPLAYNGNSDQLKFCKTMNISLAYKENGLFKQKKSDNKEGLINIADIVVNVDSNSNGLNSLEDYDFGGSVSITDLPIIPYYIISERALLPALEDLATWKTQKGYEVITKAIEDIYEDSRYKVGTNDIVDEAASLRKYLQDEYAEHGSFFCFLVGDHRTKMPIRKVVTFNSQTVVKNPNEKGYIPTDNYFSDLSEDGWPLFKEANGIYVAYYETSYVPYIYVGRLLCHSKEEISNYIKKLILYETNPGRGNSNYLNNAMIFVQQDGQYKYRDTLNKLSDTFETVDCILDSKMESDTAESYPTGETIINKMNLTGYNSLMGHGDPATIACSGRGGKYNEWEFIKALNSYKYDIDSAKRQINLSKPCYNNGLDLLCNYDSPSVIYTMSCTTMPFDVYSESGHIFDLPHTMASSFTVGGSFGGVAYIGNTRSGYWGTSPLLEVRFLQQLKNQVKIGIAEALSKYNFMSDNEVLHTHNLIGDPEFELWKGKPLEREVFVSWNDKEVAVDGEDVVGSTVVINNGEGYFHSHTVKKSLGFVYSGGGKMEAVGVYKTGYLPMVKLDCYDDQLEDCTKKFAVRSSELGCHESKSVSIGSDAEVDIRAVDSIETGSGLSIANDGELILRCDKEVSLNGSSVNNGGSLTVKGEKVILSNGFSVKAGGSLSINDI